MLYYFETNCNFYLSLKQFIAPYIFLDAIWNEMEVNPPRLCIMWYDSIDYSCLEFPRHLVNGHSIATMDVM